MGSDSVPNYRLRINKVADRELFIGVLTRLAHLLGIENYQYIGLGGPFLEDFRLVHSRLGISDLVCIEEDEDVHKRQIFNRPTNNIKFEWANMIDYLDDLKFEKSVIIWFDYSSTSELRRTIDSFTNIIPEVPMNSILRITINANPSSLGEMNDSKFLAWKEEKKTGENMLQEWRLERLKDRISSYLPSSTNPTNLYTKKYGLTLLKSVEIAIAKKMRGLHDRKCIWLLVTHYADGQPMVTATILVCNKKDREITKAVREWSFASNPTKPIILDLPVLSSKERLVLESSDDIRNVLDYNLPKTEFNVNPFESFEKFNRIFPHFSRVEL